MVSNVTYNEKRPDVILMAVTSQVRGDADALEIPIAEWQGAGLLKPSVVKPLLATLEQGLVIRQLGSLTPSGRIGLKAGLNRLLG